MYACLAAYYWHKESDALQSDAHLLPLSIIILARNEEENIEDALNSIRACDYPEDHFEIILMDDHSDDRTIERAESLGWSSLKILQLKDFDLGRWGHAYKKAALYYAVQSARHAHVLQMDADCTCSKNWMKQMQRQLHTSMVAVGPIDISDHSKGFLETWQTYESIGTMVSTFLGHRLDLWYSGASANMGYHKEVYNNYIANHEPRQASGDDVFMLEHATSHKRKISFVKSKDAVVKTAPVHSLGALYRQRMRWASKTTSYESSGLKIFMVAMASYHILLVVSLIYVILTLGTGGSILILGAFTCKWLGDLLIIGPSASFFGHKYNPIISPIMSLAHAIYVCVISITATFKKDYKWKDRQVK